MSIFSKLRGAFGAKAGEPVLGSAPPSAARSLTIEVRRGFIRVDAIDFYGEGYLSPSQQWAVGCRDSDVRGQVGCRDRGNGRVVLLDMLEERLACELRSVERPFNAATSDSGVFVVHDAFFGPELSGRVSAFNPDGTEVFRRDYLANVYAIAISPCGKFAVAQTNAAPDSVDDNLLEAFDLSTGKVLFSVHPSTEWATEYRFEVERGTLKKLFAAPGKLGSFAYSASGEFLDGEKYQEAQLTKGDYGTRTRAVERLLRNAEALGAAERSLYVLSGVLTEVKGKAPDWEARAYRLQGEALERLGRPDEALTAYERALVLNPKIGVKKRVDKLRRASETAG